MKTTNLYGMLLFFAVLSLTSCGKDDELDIAQLTGKWSVTNDDPRLAVDGSVEYIFNSDKACTIINSDFLSGRDTIIYRTYIISMDNKLITLFNEEDKYTEQYTIRKLTSKEMRWENASPKDGNSDKRLIRVD